mmetsp:Transcript_43263/g.108359  ORF Transcript_43263/g.108359 Transcript_43263/m.108359 type:complete len:337 (-) Transcript_43263:38-1048(-)
MPTLKPLEHKHMRPWETVAEAVWKRYPAAARFPQRKEITLTGKRIGPKLDTAVMERTVVYNYADVIPLFLKTFVGGGENWETHEKLTFEWRTRRLEVEVTNETGKGQFRYTEKTLFTPHPESELYTLVRQTGFFESDLIFGVDQLGVQFAEDTHQLNFTHNRDADISLIEEMARGASKQVVGYCPTYLRQLFEQDPTYAKSMPPLPPNKDATKSKAPDAPKSEAMKLDLAMDPQEAKRKLAWMFAPTPPLTKSVRGGGKEAAPTIDIPSRLGKRGSAYECMHPQFGTMHTFAQQTVASLVPPPLEIYGSSQEMPQDDAAKRGASGANQAASSLVMF